MSSIFGVRALSAAKIVSKKGIPLLEFHRCHMRHLRVNILTRVKSPKDFISSQNAFNQSKERNLKHMNVYRFHQHPSDIDGFTVDQIYCDTVGMAKNADFCLYRKNLLSDFYKTTHMYD